MIIHETERAARLERELRVSHADLLAKLRGIEAMVEASPPAPGDLARRLNAMAEMLERHFEQEEAQDLYTWAPSQYPTLRDELRALRDAHAPLIEKLRLAADDVAGEEAPINLGSELSVRIRQTVADLRKHEAGEASVVERIARAEAAAAG